MERDSNFSLQMLRVSEGVSSDVVDCRARLRSALRFPPRRCFSSFEATRKRKKKRDRVYWQRFCSFLCLFLYAAVSCRSFCVLVFVFARWCVSTFVARFWVFRAIRVRSQSGLCGGNAIAKRAPVLVTNGVGQGELRFDDGVTLGARRRGRQGKRRCRGRETDKLALALVPGLSCLLLWGAGG